MGIPTTISTIVPKRATFKDFRGEIFPLIDSVPFASVLRITCKTGAVRANHWHKDDYHVCYLSKGSMLYYERPVNSKEKPTKTLIFAGDTFLTPTAVEHAMEFLEDSEFFCFSKLSREQENYESDTVRLTEDLTKI